MARRFVLAVLVVVASAVPVAPLVAQQAAPERQQAISISPILALFKIVQAEYERAVSDNWTLVAGLGYWSFGDETDEVSWLATDLKARFYPAGNPLEGFSIGGIVGSPPSTTPRTPRARTSPKPA